MKQLFVILPFVFFTLFSNAQYVPQGMNYQAVARNLSGDILANEPISLKIKLYNSAINYYVEIHNTTTNKLGLFTLIIGAGKVEIGEFEKVPWSNEQIWMEVSIKNKNQLAFTTISSCKLLAVPYAFHAGTASALAHPLQTDGNSIPSSQPSAFTAGAAASSESTITITDNLTTKTPGTVLDAHQGYVLNGLVNSKIDTADAKIYFDPLVFKGLHTSEHDASWLVKNPVGSINNPITIGSGTVVSPGTGSVSTTDADAQAYFDRLATAGYTVNGAEKTAYNNFVSAAKTNGYYFKLKALWIYLGSANSHRIINSLSSSFTQTWGSGVSFISGASGGVKGDGTVNGYINSNITPSADLVDNNLSVGCWIVESAAEEGVAFGASQSNNQSIRLVPKWSNNTAYANVYKNGVSTSAIGIVPVPSTEGLWVLSKTSINLYKVYLNKVVIGSSTFLDNGALVPNVPLYFLASNSGSAVENPSRKTHKIEFAGVGLTDVDVSNIYNDLSILLTAIGR